MRESGASPLGHIVRQESIKDTMVAEGCVGLSYFEPMMRLGLVSMEWSARCSLNTTHMLEGRVRGEIRWGWAVGKSCLSVYVLFVTHKTEFKFYPGQVNRCCQRQGVEVGLP